LRRPYMSERLVELVLGEDGGEEALVNPSE
jgi:hypothetical protein